MTEMEIERDTIIDYDFTPLPEQIEEEIVIKAVPLSKALYNVFKHGELNRFNAMVYAYYKVYILKRNLKRI